MDSQQFREAAVSSIDEIVKYYDNIEERRVLSEVEPGYLRKLLPDHPPQDGEAWEDIQKDIETKIMPGITHWQSPNFLAWFPCASSYPGMLGEMWSAALNSANFNWVCSPAVTELETVVLDWLARAFALPDCYLSAASSPSSAGGGVIHGSASEAVATVLVAARDKYLREATEGLGLEPGSEELEDALAERRGRLVALASTATHSCTRKAAQIAGVRFRAIPARAEDGYRMTAAGVREAVRALRARGLEPFFLTATMGTTDTCAVDDMGGIADAMDELRAEAAREGGGSGGGGSDIWVHVDAAYAGVALVCPEHREPALMGALARFHSFNTNMHKWLLTNFDCSALWVRDGSWLVRSLSVSLAILSNRHSDSGLVTDYRDWQIPFGRRFRSLKVWFVLRSYGVRGLQAHIRKHVALSEAFAAMVRAHPDLLEVLTGPRFALTVFRLKAPPPPGSSGGAGDDDDDAAVALERQNALTKKMYDSVVEGGKIFLSSTVIGGTFAIRHVPATPFVEEHHVKHHFEVLVEAAEKTLASL